MPELLLERPPEAEIYGRSLRTIHRLGALMVDKAVPEITSSPEADQARVEFYTSVEEGFGTDEELGYDLEVRDFDERPVIGGKVMSKDLKTAVSDMTEAGLICAQKTAKEDERFSPQLTRSYWDHQNALLVDQMAWGETEHNTIIVVSPFVEEAAAQSGDEYWRNVGYVPHRKRGFVQLYHARGGKVITGSLSFDGSDKQHLRMIFAQYGVDIPEAEITDNWLQYPITKNLSEDEAKELAIEIADQANTLTSKKATNTVDVTREHRALMDQVFNESYVHVCESLFRGYQTEEVRELILQFADQAQHFNVRYAKALYKMRANSDQFTDDDSIVLHELLVYSTIEMMRALHLQKRLAHQDTYFTQDQALQVQTAYLQSMDPSSFQGMLSSFGADGAKSGRTYSACGLAISPGDNDAPWNSPQNAFGGKTEDSSSEAEGSDKECDFISKECPLCKKKNVKTTVTKTHISGDCGCKISKPKD